MHEDAEAKRQLNEFGFNMVVSDKIAMNRTIPDTRLDEYVTLFYSRCMGTGVCVCIIPVWMGFYNRRSCLLNVHVVEFTICLIARTAIYIRISFLRQSYLP